MADKVPASRLRLWIVAYRAIDEAGPTSTPVERARAERLRVKIVKAFDDGNTAAPG